MLNRLLICISFLIVANVHASVVRVLGTAPGYEGRKVAVIAMADEISGRRNLLTSADVRDDASFELEFDVEETQRVYIHIQRIEAALYVQPGNTYRCMFPQVSRNDYKRFDRTEVELEFVDLPASDLNQAIRKFNLDYSNFISEHFYDFASQEYRGSAQYLSALGDRKSKVDLFAKRNSTDSVKYSSTTQFKGWVKQFDDSVSLANMNKPTDDFFRTYITFATAELYLLSGMNRVDFYENYLMSISLPMRNPAFISCFKLFYQNMLTGRKSELQSKIMKAINVDRSFATLSENFAADSTLLSKKLRDLACLNGLREVYNNKSFDRGSIDLLLRKINSEDSTVNTIAQNVLYQFKRCAPGEAMPSLVLTNEIQEKWAVADYNGVPLYLYFFATWSPASLKDLLVIERWQEKFAGRLEFVAVSMDDDYRDFRKYLEDHPKQALTFVYGNADPFIQEKINLRAIPYQLLISDDGKVLSDFAPAPSDPTFESLMNRVALKEDGQRQRPKTWKDH
jgi:thiol-disulfide isomerase/thioredoxin